MQYSYINATGDGSRTAWVIPFPFIDGDHIFVTAVEDYAVSDQTLIFDTAPSGSFRIYRKTPPSLTTSTATMFRNEEFEDWRNILLSKVSQDDVDAAVEGLRSELLPEIALAQTKDFALGANDEDGLDPDEFPDPAPTWAVAPELVADEQVSTYKRLVQFRWDIPDPTYAFCRVECIAEGIDRVIYGNEITFTNLSWTTGYTFNFRGYNTRGQETELYMSYAIAPFSVVYGPSLGIIAVDTIDEDTPDNGVNVDGLLIKDGGMDDLKVGDANAHTIDNIWRGEISVNTTVSADSTFTDTLTVDGARVGDFVITEQDSSGEIFTKGRVSANDTVTFIIRNTSSALGVGINRSYYVLVINHF